MAATALKKISVQEDDPKRDILDKLGDLSGFQIAQNEVLLAIYQRPQKTAGGIILTHNTRKEDVYQGKVGLVVKIGTACRFVRTDEDGVIFGIPIKLHDWVVVRPSDTWSLDMNGNEEAVLLEDFVPCRLTYDDQIRMKVKNPMAVW